MSKLIHIFTPGQHTAMNGLSLNFTEADLKASAQAYDPALHEAPIVVGHPKADAPAYGWVKGLSYAEGLQADPHQVDVAFSEMVNAGRFKKVSASFYLPDSPANPVPGVYYLRHVGFLGAQPPAIKGLKPVEFNEAEIGVINFADMDDIINASLWRNLREFFISKFSLADADNTIPGYAVSQLEQMAQEEPDETDPSIDSSSLTQTDYQELAGAAMSTAERARLAALETENATLRAAQLAANKTAKEQRTAALHIEHTHFAESLLKEGRLLPTQIAVSVAALDFLASQDQPVEFAEGEINKPLLDGVKGLLSALPKQIEFSELGAGDTQQDQVVNFAAPVGFAVDNNRLKAHTAALNYQRQHTCDYITAVKAIGVN
jgi:hypothetical protein